MDPISAAIIAALAAGITAGLGEAAKKAISDAYAALKARIEKKPGKDSELAKAVAGLEAKPASEGRKATLQEEVQAAKADQDAELLALAKALIETIQKQAIGPAVNVEVRDGAAAVGDRSIAAGKDAVIVTGNVQGDFIARGGKKA